MHLHKFFFLPLLVLASPLLEAKHYKLFVLTGQSNSLGTTNGGEADPTSGSDPADQHVIFSWHNVVDASTSIGHSGSTLSTPTTTADFTTLQDQQGGHYPGSATHWGGEIEFARSLYRAGVRDFGVIKASRGGGANTLWSKSGGGHMYTHVVDTVNEAVASLDPADTFEIVGLMYLQGESDGTGTNATEAGNRLKDLTDNLRIDLPNASSLHTVAAGTTARGAASMVQQEAIAASTSYIDFFPNTDLASGGLAGDGLHLNKSAKITVGQRWAQAFLDAGIVSRHYGNLVFIGDSITQGGSGDYPSYRYQVFENLANQGVPKNTATGYQFVGSQTGPYLNSTLTTPDVNGQSFDNVHEGHWGWRIFWSNARIALPGGRYNVNNLGQGTLANWLGTASPDEFVTTNAGTLAYTGTNYTPDTAVIMMGINDIDQGSSATQVRDDLGTVIDQLRADNPNVRIHLCEILDAVSVSDSLVDGVNALLPQLVADKNAASTTSPVWLVETHQGFDPSAGVMTHDGTHPNATGEELVGNIISTALSIIGQTEIPVTPAAITEKSSTEVGCYHFEGGDINNSGSFASGWSYVGSKTVTEGDDVRIVNPGAGASWLEGTDTGWSDINHTDWVYETRIKFDTLLSDTVSIPDTIGYRLWLGTGTDVIYVDIYQESTRGAGGAYNVAHAAGDHNDNGEFHTFRVEHDSANGVYHLWRNGERLTPVNGSAYDSGNNEERLIMGDFTGNPPGDNFDVTIDYVRFCQTFNGSQIYNGSAYINGWSHFDLPSPAVVNTDELQIVNTGDGTWIEGTNTGWSANNSDDWTIEMRAKFDEVSNGFAIWMGTGSNRSIVKIYADRTQSDGGASFNVAHNNEDGAYHIYRITHDSEIGVYHVFRDGVRLTPVAGVAYDSSAGEARLILGDFGNGAFGANFDVTIDYINIDYSGVWIPQGTDTDGDGISDLWEDTHFDGITEATAGEDSDGDDVTNLDEYYANTDPNNKDAFFTVESITETTTDDVFRVTVPNTAADRVYTLQRNTTLTGMWTDIAGQGPFSGNGGNLDFDVPSALDKDFFRVKVSLP